MTWLRKTAALVEVVMNRPEATASGTCPFCATMDGEDVEEVGFPPYHKNCSCTTRTVQKTTHPREIFEEEFTGLDPLDSIEPEVDLGGVEEL